MQYNLAFISVKGHIRTLLEEFTVPLTVYVGSCHLSCLYDLAQYLKLEV